MNIVVGSGPSGVAVAEALLAAGRPVMILDSGLTLEAEREDKKRRLARADPSSWTDADRAFLQGPAAPSGKVPIKHSFGSDFPYASPQAASKLATDGTDIRPSFAAGGLSTVWGSAILPFRDADISDWPINSQDLREGYAAASRMMPLSAARDDLESTFPLYRPPEACLPLSRQAKGLMRSLESSRAHLRAKGLSFGRARLAVDAPRCVLCGLCLQGCPHDLIYAGTATLERHRRGGLSYQRNVIVRAITEVADGIEVHAVRFDGSICHFKGCRVFLAAGVVNTAEILLRSMRRYDRPVQIKDAQYFLVPLLRWRGTPAVERERLNTLCQAFLELDDPALSPFTIHMQAYTYSEIVRAAVVAKAGRWQNMIPLAAVLGRLLVLQSYLHSDHSGTIEATLRRGDAGDCPSGDHLSLVGKPRSSTVSLVSSVVRKLDRLARHTGFSPIKPLVEITAPGRGFHVGGSFPMAHRPDATQTDLLGRPNGFSRLHLADASTFPSIPATTITLTAMANAYRIGAATIAAGLS